ncbi:hypothetical protein GCM10010413_53540 [Promicromonospora sukumoe]|uniref:Uncharacterized protein n=1 Tax=Promicromonospora sukumoe TaxID=88382 RepID=A0A7W3JCY3_9MICO|nr:hypothetical protein [Promicromonospora sukumoe]MBA8810557.1 hypothetical protein [Promicromonospora sukumoe]
MDQVLQEATRTAPLELHQSGSPIVSEENVNEMIAIAARRWRSFERRSAKRSGDLGARTEDLAKGLRDHFEVQPHLVGQLMEDYRFLAGVLATEFSREI